MGDTKFPPHYPVPAALAQIVEEAVKLPTLKAALAHGAICETDRIVRSHKPGHTYDSCFEFMFGKIIERWSELHPQFDLEDHYERG